MDIMMCFCIISLKNNQNFEKDIKILQIDLFCSMYKEKKIKNRDNSIQDTVCL